MEIKSGVKNLEHIEWDVLKTYEFNELKNNKNRDVSKLKKTILKDGFSFPFICWKEGKYVIDGMGRKKAIEEIMSEAGDIIINKLPVVFIEAKDKKDAKKKALLISSSYGDISKGSLELFADDFQLEDLSEVSLGMEKINIDELFNNFEDERFEKEVNVKEIKISKIYDTILKKAGQEDKSTEEIIEEIVTMNNLVKMKV